MPRQYRFILSPSQQIAIRAGLLDECVYHGEVYQSYTKHDPHSVALSATGFENVFDCAISMREEVIRAFSSAPSECAACMERISADLFDDDHPNGRVHVF